VKVGQHLFGEKRLLSAELTEPLDVESEYRPERLAETARKIAGCLVVAASHRPGFSRIACCDGGPTSTMNDARSSNKIAQGCDWGLQGRVERR